MNQRCLYCYKELEEGQVDFHAECATELFGCAKAPSYPFDDTLLDTYIIKEKSEDYIPELEAVAMRMARSVLVLTVSSTLLPCNDGAKVYLAKRDASAEGIDKLVERLEGCEFDGSVEMIGELVEDFSSISRLDIVTFFEHVIFGWVAGCNDMDISSFALSRPNDGVCSLAAAYDFVPMALGSSNDSFKLEVNGRHKGISRRDFEASMRLFGLKDRIIRITIEKMLKAKDQWLQIIDDSPLPDDVKASYSSYILARLAILS